MARTSCCCQGNADRNTKGTGRNTSSFFLACAFQAPCSLMQPIECNRKPAGERHSMQSSSPSTTIQNAMVDLELRDNGQVMKKGTLNR